MSGDIGAEMWRRKEVPPHDVIKLEMIYKER